MRVVKMEYNPYKMKTSICIDGSDVKGNSNYRSIDDFIERRTPLQTWVEPIDYLNWPGLLNEIADPENNGEIEFCFSGRKIDFEDLKRFLEDQNKNREEGTRLSLRFRQKIIADGNEAGVKQGEHALNEIAGFNAVASEAGKILDNDAVDLIGPHQLNELLHLWTLKIRAAVPVVDELHDLCVQNFRHGSRILVENKVLILNAQAVVLVRRKEKPMKKASSPRKTTPKATRTALWASIRPPTSTMGGGMSSTGDTKAMCW